MVNFVFLCLETNLSYVLHHALCDLIDIINPNSFDEEETHNEDGSVNKEGIVLCFEENVEYCIAEILKTSEDKLDITWDDRREFVEHFKTFVFSYGK